MSQNDQLQITLETEIADAIKRFESESGQVVIDIRMDRYDGPHLCIGTTLSGEPANA